MRTENLLRNPENARKIVGSKENKLVEKVAAERGITLIKNENILPMDLTINKKVLFIAETKSRGNMMESEAIKIEGDIKVTKIATNYKVGLTSEIQREIKKSDYIVLATYNLKNNTKVEQIINFANKNNKKLVTISTRNPYDIIYTPTTKANIAIYGITGFDLTNNGRNSLEANIRAGIRTIFVGEDKTMLNTPTAKLPIEIKDDSGKVLFNRGYGLTY
jgi:beta-N-acetylhexosaminidase